MQNFVEAISREELQKKNLRRRTLKEEIEKKKFRITLEEHQKKKLRKRAAEEELQKKNFRRRTLKDLRKTTAE